MLRRAAQDWRNEQSAEARAEARAEAHAQTRHEILLRLLRRAGLAVSANQRAQILRCTDLARLDRWIDQVLDARSTSAVLAARPAGARHTAPAASRRSATPKRRA